MNCCGSISGGTLETEVEGINFWKASQEPNEAQIDKLLYIPVGTYAFDNCLWSVLYGSPANVR